MSLTGERGLTLIEVMVATAVFGLVVFVLTAFYFTASSQALIGRGVTTGLLLAQQQVETLKSKSYASLAGGTTTETLDELGSPAPGGRYVRQTVITKPHPLYPALAQVEVTVTWQEGTVTRRVNVTTLLGDF